MNISKVIQYFPLDKDSSNLDIYIGKNLNRQCFSIHNKIFFDILHSFLLKNGWNITQQYLSKKMFYEQNVLQSTFFKKQSDVCSFKVPFEQQLESFGKSNSILKKLKGTYYDLFCEYYQKNVLDLEHVQAELEKTHNEVTEEISVFKKMGVPCELHFSVEKLSMESSPLFSVKIIFTKKIQEEEPLLQLFEIIDLAMTKYKKTDKTIYSLFTSFS